MTVAQQGIDLSDFFSGGEFDEEIESSVQELRSALRDYNIAKKKSGDGSKAQAEAKKRIEELFSEIPDEYKVTQALPAKTVANVLFSREKKTITIDGWLLVFNDKINTKAPREKYLKELRSKAATASTPEARDAYRDAIEIFERMEDPKKGNELKIEPASTKSE